MADYSTLFVLGALAVYVIAMVCFAVDISALGRNAPQREVRKAANIAMALSWLGLALQGVGLVLRAVQAGRVPWANMYEFTLTFTFAAMAIFLVLQRKRDIRYLGVFVTFMTVLGLILAVSVLFVPADGVQPALNSYWLAIHVSVAAGTTGLFTVAAGASVLQLVQHRQSQRRVAAAEPALVTAGASGGETSARAKPPASFVGRVMTHVPDEESLERFAYRLNAVGFVGWTFTVVAGAIWAEHAWGRPWGWDPKETWSLVVWLIYAAYLHVRATVGWSINRFAWFALLGYTAVLANFSIVNLFFSGRHTYSGL